MSEGAAPPGCPEAPVLAAFIERTLDGRSRRELERHIADCSECCVVVAETARFLRDGTENTEPNVEPRARRRWRLIAAAVAATFVGVLIWTASANRDPLDRVKRIAAESPLRPIEGRLADMSYAPFTVPRSGRPSQENTIAFRAEAERLERAQADTKSLHARGVALLLAGDISTGVALLESVARQAPHDANVWADLSAAYLASGIVGNRVSLESAVRAGARAAALDRSLAAAYFNQAVALHRLGRVDEAVARYRRAIELDPASAWSEEAAERIARLRQ